MGSACSCVNDTTVASPRGKHNHQPEEHHSQRKLSESNKATTPNVQKEPENNVEVRKAHSFKLPPARVSFIGFKENNKKGTDEQYGEILCSYLPQHLLYNLKSLYYKNSNVQDKKSASLLVEEEKVSDMSPLSTLVYDTCILMIDISGFTPLTETLSKEPNGAELLSKYINQYFTTLIAFIYEYGGDVERFAGDAIICQFHYPRKDRTLAECVVAAVQCALRIQNTEYLRHFKVNDTLSLQIHCGVSLGKVTTNHLGGVNDYWLRITSGQALLDMSSALGNSENGQVVLTKPAYEKCANYITCRRLDVKDAEVFLAIGSKREPSSALGLPPLTLHKNFISVLRKFVSPPVLQKIDAGQSEWINEVRPLTVGFLSIVNTAKSDSADDELKAYQTYLLGVQTIMAQYEGFIANMLSDEKGTILVFCFGYPKTHTSDPVRAVKAGIDLTAKLSQAGMKFGLGIASGKCFIGNVGSEYRKEFTVYGDKVNLAARLMKESETNDGVVLCDEDTSKLLKGVPIEALEPIKVKGKSDLIKIWKVVDASISTTQLYYNIKKTPSQIINDPEETETDEVETTPIERLMSLKYPIGRESIFHDICKYVNDKLQEFEDGKEKTRTKIIMIKGDQGVGKSDLLKRLVVELKTKLACVYNSAIEFETPFYLYLSNLKISMTERIFKMNGQTIDYSDIDNQFNKISKEQRETLLLETFPDEKDRNCLFLLNSVFGTEFKEIPGVKYEIQERIEISADLFARFLSFSWLYMGYISQPWFLLYDDFHFSMQYDPYSRIVTKKILELDPGKTNCILLLSYEELPEESSLDERRKELDDWIAKSDLHIDLKEFSKDDCEEYVKVYSNAKRVDPKVLDIFFEKTQGNPQFLNLAMNFMLETDRITVEDDVLKMRLAMIDEIELPSSMSSFFQQKIDRLDVDSQLVLKVASAVGLQFDLETLVTIFPPESNVKKEGRIPDIIESLVHNHQFLDTVEITNMSKHFLSCSAKKDTIFKFKTSMTLEIVYNTVPKDQKREFHLSLAKYFIKQIEERCTSQKSKERSSMYITEIANHLGHYYDKITLDEILALDSFRKEELFHLVLAIIVIPRAMSIIAEQHEASMYKHLIHALTIILEKIVTLWKGEKNGIEAFRYMDLLESSTLNVMESSFSLVEIARTRFEGLREQTLSSFNIFGISKSHMKELLARSLFKYGLFIQGLFDSNLLSRAEDALKKAKDFCPKSAKDLAFHIESERWFIAFLSETDDALSLGTSLVDLSNEIGDPSLQMYGYIACMMSHNTRGNFNKVVLFSEEVINQYMGDPDRYHQLSINNFRKRDALLVSCTYCMRAMWSIGRYEAAQKYLTLGTEHSKVRLHLPSFLFFFSFACYYLLLSGQLDELERTALQGQSIISIFSNNVAPPNQILSIKFYLTYVKCCREVSSNSSLPEEKLKIVKEYVDHLESLFNSLHAYSPPNIIYNFAILESRIKYLGLVDVLKQPIDRKFFGHTDVLFNRSLKSNQENLVGEILRLKAKYQILKSSISGSGFTDCIPEMEQTFSDAFGHVTAQSAHGVKFRLLMEKYDCYMFLIEKGAQELENKLPTLVSDMDYLIENYIEKSTTTNIFLERYRDIKNK